MFDCSPTPALVLYVALKPPTQKPKSRDLQQVDSEPKLRSIPNRPTNTTSPTLRRTAGRMSNRHSLAKSIGGPHYSNGII